MRDAIFLTPVRHTASLFGHELTMDYVRMTGEAHKIVTPHRFTMPIIECDRGDWMNAAVTGLVRQSAQLPTDRYMSIIVVDPDGRRVLESVSDRVANHFVEVIERRSWLGTTLFPDQVACRFEGAASPIVAILNPDGEATVYSVSSQDGTEPSARVEFDKLSITPIYLKEEAKLQAPAGLFKTLQRAAGRKRHLFWDQHRDRFEVSAWFWDAVSKLEDPLVRKPIDLPDRDKIDDANEMHQLMKMAFVHANDGRGGTRSVQITTASRHGPVEVKHWTTQPLTHELLTEIAAEFWPYGERIVRYETNRASSAVIGGLTIRLDFDLNDLSAHELLAPAYKLAEFLKSRNLPDAEIDRLLSGRER